MNKQKGITLIALVVTIIVLIILAGISVNLILGENGIITKAQEARRVQEIAEIKSDIQLDIMAKEAEVLPSGNKITMAQTEEILGKYGTVNKEGGKIKSLTPTGKDYEIPFEEIYKGSVEHTGLYYNQPYTFTVDDVSTTFVFGNDGKAYGYSNGVSTGVSSDYTINNDGNVVLDGKEYVVSKDGSCISMPFGSENVLYFTLNIEKSGIQFGSPYTITIEGETLSAVFNEDGSANMAGEKIPAGFLKYCGNEIIMTGDGSKLYVSLDGTQIILLGEIILTLEKELVQTYGSAVSSLGDGYTLYNGIKLPKLPVDLNIEEYPYIHISSIDMGLGEFYVLLVSYVPSYYESSYNAVSYDYKSAGIESDTIHGYIYAYDPNHVMSGLWETSDNEWGYISSQDMLDDVSPQKSTHLYVSVLIWSNLDVVDKNTQDVFMPYSEPIALDGMVVIEWDGDITGLESTNFSGANIYNYKLADYYNAVEGLMVTSFSDGKNLVTNQFEKGEYNSWSISEYNVVAISPEDSESNTGIYCFKQEDGASSMYASLIAFKIEE